MQKKSKMVTLVLLTAGALVTHLGGCQRLHGDQEDIGGGGVFYNPDYEAIGASGYSYHSGISVGLGFSPSAGVSHVSRGGFGGHGHGGG